ncbi:unnamed protein product, partial [Mesorhabditis spiculigera]
MALAEALCQADGGHLASVHDNSTTYLLMDFIASHGIGNAAWIGLKNLGGNSSWTDGSKLDFANYAPRQDPAPVCYAFSTAKIYYPGQWLSVPCESHFHAVCARPQGLPMPTQPAPPTCGNTTFFGNNGTVQSPGYPFEFSDRQSCQYQISAFNNYANVEISVIRALNDYNLNVFDGTDQTKPLWQEGRFTQRTYTLTLSSGSPQIRITWYSSGDNNVQPFTIHYSGTATPLYVNPTPRPVAEKQQ